MTDQQLISLAHQAKEFAYTPYYKFRVGAALVTENGKVFTGCNIETSAGFSICAERVAFSKALSEGEKNIAKIAIVSDADKFITPCGVCRQFMTEFAPECKIILSSPAEIKSVLLSELLPMSFKL